MTHSYLPIIKAKPGELKAFTKTKGSVSKKTLPLFEVGRMSESIRTAKRFEESSAITCAYLDETASRIAEVRKGESALVDAYQWPPNSTTETGEHVLPYIYSKLKLLGVNVIPVIGYDRWDSTQYKLAMQNLEVAADSNYCLRLDSHAIEDAADPEFFEEQVFGILDDLNLEPDHFTALVDFGDITHLSLEELIVQGNRVIELLVSMGFRRVATAGCSLPPTIDGAVKKQNSNGYVVRKEMLLWQTLRTEHPRLNWLFGDYGVRGPNTAEGVKSPHTNGKIRYTINKQFFVVRGHSVQTGDKGAQMHKLSKTLVESDHYLGRDFSWGDTQILDCSLGKFSGNSQTWIAIDTNHHIAYVVAEIEEFEQSITVAKSTALQ